MCHFPIGILGQVWYLIVSIPDLCTLTYFRSTLNKSEGNFLYVKISITSKKKNSSTPDKDISDILSWNRKPYLTHVILPKCCSKAVKSELVFEMVVPTG